ncbi:hypothetical protein Vadar_014953 [Vaccinium darrowii]|uniref:Uncharacterized protein n=1 Tax=Vaccinium darrowii TaxID=229202 RepID=A0ACB7Y007_9ERIC|nr:hypothetical protein Vadar_014953 [Vaccinium darrowii]
MVSEKWLPKSEPAAPVCIGNGDRGLKVSDFIDRPNNAWKSEEVLNYFCEEDANVILQIPLPISPVKDKRVWHFTTNGEYSVKSGYELALMMKRNGLLGVGGSGCPLCGDPEESVIHLVAKCPFARAVWFSSPLQIDSQVLECSSFIRWWSELMQRGQGFQDAVHWRANIAYLVWGIWKSRNQAMFDHCRADPVWVMQQAVRSAAEFLEAYKEEESEMEILCADRPSKQVQWQAPTSGSCGGLRARSAIVMESLALRAGVLLAMERGFRRVIFEGDAKGLIDALSGRGTSREDIQLLVWDILQLCNSLFTDFSFVFVGRKCNSVAHELASKGYSSGICSNWIAIPPLWLWDLICREKGCCT